VRLARLIARPVVLDAGLALLFAAASLPLARDILLVPSDGQAKAVALLGSRAEFQEHISWWWAGTAGAVVALLLRSRRPVLAFVIAGASVLVHVADIRLQQVGLRLLPIDLIAAMTLYTLTSMARVRRAGPIALCAGIALVYLAILADLSLRPDPRRAARAAMLAGAPGTNEDLVFAASMAVLPALLLGIAWAVGDATRTHRIHRAASEQRAAAAQREQEQRAALAVAAERARISRELHDVVAHGISVMVVQAQAAEAALDAEPATSREAIGHVIDTGRASLAEMRRVLSVIRTEPRLAPPPGVDALPALLDQVRDAGTPVSLVIDGDPVGLPAAVDLSAYRIVQEALTNTRRHAGAGAQATVRLAYQPDQLEIEVADDGSGSADPKGGNGLRGIVERVGALGGQVDAGPLRGGGFGVRAILPIGAGL